jgi:chromosome segregation ATPase
LSRRDESETERVTYAYLDEAIRDLQTSCRALEDRVRNVEIDGQAIRDNIEAIRAVLRSLLNRIGKVEGYER